MNRKITKECESCCEYVLPDYMGDIRKVLTSRARVVPGGSFVSDGGVEISGVVEYEIVYSDSENKLTVISCSSDYAIKAQADTEECEGVFAESYVSLPSIRITGPRKLVIKATVGTDAVLMSEAHLSVSGDAFEREETPECATRAINIAYSRNGESGEREYAEEAERLEGVRSDEVEILSTGGSVRVIETESVDGGVRIKGELIIDAIIRTPVQPAIAIRKIIPFEETVSLDGASADMQSLGGGYVTSAVCGLNDEEGACVVVVNVIAEYYASVYENESLEVITDAYLKSAETENRYSAFEYGKLCTARNFEIPISCNLAKEAVGCMDASEIVTMLADVRACSVSVDENGAHISGEIAISGVACENNVDGSETYVPIKTQISFEENVNIDCQNYANSMIDCKIYAVMCDGELDAENLYVKILLCGKIKVEERCEIMRLESSSVIGEPKHKSTASRITVYYPTKGDTLFSVAKKFHTTTAKIAEDNAISESVLASGIDSCLEELERLVIR